jgi:hypothetical protein
LQVDAAEERVVCLEPQPIDLDSDGRVAGRAFDASFLNRRGPNRRAGTNGQTERRAGAQQEAQAEDAPKQDGRKASIRLPASTRGVP